MGIRKAAVPPPMKGHEMTKKSGKNVDKIEEKADQALIDGVPDELKNTDPDGAGHPTHVSPAAVVEGKAEAEPVVKSHEQ